MLVVLCATSFCAKPPLVTCLEGPLCYFKGNESGRGIGSSAGDRALTKLAWRMQPLSDRSRWPTIGTRPIL